MAFKCDFCAKGPQAGKSVSHSHRATNRRFMPNLQRIKVMLKGKVQHAYACSACLRSNKVRKAA